MQAVKWRQSPRAMTFKMLQESGPPELLASFADYKRCHDRAYSSPEAEARAVYAFKENMKLIQRLGGARRPVNMSDYK